AMRATAFNQQVAQSLGISVKSVFAMAWAISATVSAVAGVVVAVVNGVSAGLSAYGVKVFRAAILGGLDSVGGAVLGGIIIGLLIQIGIFGIAALGLNIVVGFTGQISVGHAAFFGFGAFTAAYLSNRFGIPVFFCIPLAGVVTAAVGLIFGLPAARLKGLYL